MSTPDLVQFGDAYDGAAALTDLASAPRAPRIPERIGVQREPLPRAVRRAVLLRDAFTCRWCHTKARGDGVLLEIDHIVPWSAGGADHPVNLRTLCRGCNQERSNRVTALDRRALPIVLRCRRCESGPMGDAVFVEAHCLSCRSPWAAPYLSDLLVGGVVPTVGVPLAGPGDEAYPGLAAAQRPGMVRQLDLLCDRLVAQAVPCAWCSAAAGEPCVDAAGYALTKSAAHPSRLELAAAS